jgi:hypothetical protein
MESTNQRPAYLINIRKIRSFFNQVENFPIRIDGKNFVLIVIKMNTGTRTQAKRLRRNHNGVESKVSPPPDSRPGDTIRKMSQINNFQFVQFKNCSKYKMSNMIYRKSVSQHFDICFLIFQQLADSPPPN